MAQTEPLVIEREVHLVSCLECGTLAYARFIDDAVSLASKHDRKHHVHILSPNQKGQFVRYPSAVKNE